MKKLIFILVLIMFLSVTSALCEENQININSASLQELDEIYGIGPVKAQAIIDSRPFESVNDLINVYGIGEITLEKIIEQGLACVDNEEEVEEETTIEESSEEIVEINEQIIKNKINPPENKVPITPEIIDLTPKDIKTEENIEKLDKTNYIKYGFIGFCVLIGILLVLKNKRKQKNEII